MASTSFDEVLGAIEHLPFEQQAELMNVVRRRLADRGRQQIVADARESREEFAAPFGDSCHAGAVAGRPGCSRQNPPLTGGRTDTCVILLGQADSRGSGGHPRRADRTIILDRLLDEVRMYKLFDM